MNSLLISSLILLFSSFLCSNEQNQTDFKYFEGTVVYETEFINKTNKYDSVTLAVIVGSSTTLFSKGGNFLTIIENGITTNLLYRKDENKLYREKFTSDSVYWTRCDQPGQKIMKFSITPKVENILGIDCDELKVYYENKTVSYYYNSDTLKINPNWHKNFTYYNEDFYSQKMKSISLKTKIDYEDFVFISTAVRFSYQNLDNKIFEIPKKPLVEDQ